MSINTLFKPKKIHLGSLTPVIIQIKPLSASDARHKLFLQKAQEVDALGALNGHTQGTVPNKLDKRSKSTAHTKGHGVVQGLLETVVVEENTRCGIDIGMGILGLQEWLVIMLE